MENCKMKSLNDEKIINYKYISQFELDSLLAIFSEADDWQPGFFKKKLIITEQKFQWSDWSNGLQLNC